MKLASKNEAPDLQPTASAICFYDGVSGNVPMDFDRMIAVYRSIATTSRSSIEGTVRVTTPFDSCTRGDCPLVSNCTFFARDPAGNRTLTFCAGAGMSSRNGPFIIMGFVRFTRCTVMDVFCRQTVTSSVP